MTDLARIDQRHLDSVRDGLCGPLVSAAEAPAEVVELLDPRALPALPALPAPVMAWLLAYFRSESSHYLDERAAAKWAGLDSRYSPLRSRRLGAWIAAMVDGSPDAISVPEARRFLSRVVTGEQTAEVLGRDGEPQELGFPAAARLKALEILGKIDGYLVDRSQVEVKGPAAPAWDLSKLSGDQLQYLEYLQAKATGQDVPAPPLELIRVETTAELTD